MKSKKPRKVVVKPLTEQDIEKIVKDFLELRQKRIGV